MLGTAFSVLVGVGSVITRAGAATPSPLSPGVNCPVANNSVVGMTTITVAMTTDVPGVAPHTGNMDDDRLVRILVERTADETIPFVWLDGSVDIIVKLVTLRVTYRV